MLVREADFSWICILDYFLFNSYLNLARSELFFKSLQVSMTLPAI